MWTELNKIFLKTNFLLHVPPFGGSIHTCFHCQIWHDQPSSIRRARSSLVHKFPNKTRTRRLVRDRKPLLLLPNAPKYVNFAWAGSVEPVSRDSFCKPIYRNKLIGKFTIFRSYRSTCFEGFDFRVTKALQESRGCLDGDRGWVTQVWAKRLPLCNPKLWDLPPTD